MTPRVSHVTPGRACHMLPQGARATCYSGLSKAKESKAEASKATESRSTANETVTPRVSHLTPGRACHMLPRGARATCYPRARVPHVTPGGRVPHVTPGRACHMLLRAKQSNGKQSRGKQSRGKPSRPMVWLWVEVERSVATLSFLRVLSSLCGHRWQRLAEMDKPRHELPAVA